MRPSITTTARQCIPLLASLLIIGMPHAMAGAAKKPDKGDAKPAATIADPFPDPYANKTPSFVEKVRRTKGWIPGGKKMELSQEKSFFTVTLLNEDSRAYEYVKAAMAKEAEGQFRDALKIYEEMFTKVVNRNPGILYRISKQGIFVPIGEFVQRRILRYPKEDLAHYRTIHDPKAKEAFEQARRNFSLQGLSEIVDKMLATSYGDNALLELGNAALDMGHYLEALERFASLRDYFPDSECRTQELELKIAYCRKMLGDKAPPGNGGGAGMKGKTDPKRLAAFKKLLSSAKVEKPPFHSQMASAPNVSQDDYTLLPPTDDPMGLKKPIWSHVLPGSRIEFFSFSQPVITDTSVVYRHKNILYCRSILNGELRWKNNLGGRTTWQSFHARQYPQDDVLVQDGLVFSPLYKVGPSLVAFDEITGAMKWAYGPMVASSEDEARMRFEAAPAGGPRAVYAGYVLDNIHGDTHTDTEYGIMAFESRTGRVLWKAKLCRHPPEKFAGGFAKRIRNRIRSFTSPPLYHQGTVYYNTNVGAVAALDARSGRVKWLMRYPYYPGVHDATRQFGGGGMVRYTRIWASPHAPMFWFNQRPLMIGENLYVTPVDTPYLFCLDRRSGKVHWSTAKGDDGVKYRYGRTSGGASYFMGPISSGELLIAHSGRNTVLGNRYSVTPALLLNAKTGKKVWHSPDLTVKTVHPVLRHGIKISKEWAQGHGLGLSRHNRQIGARPFLSSDDRLYISSFTYMGYPIFDYVASLACLDLRAKKILGRRRYIGGNILGACNTAIKAIAPKVLKSLEALPHKDKRAKDHIRITREIAEDTVPVNEYGPFLPFSRVTFKRYGVLFEVRVSPREIYMVYDRAAVTKALKKKTGPEADFARAELALDDARIGEAATLLIGCLKAISPEDQDFRAAINQQLYRVHRMLAQSAIRSAKPDAEFQSGLGMSRTAGTLQEEIESLFALAEARERQGDLVASGGCLRTIARRYGHVEYPVAPAAITRSKDIIDASAKVMQRASDLSKNLLYGKEITQSVDLLKKGLPLYLSTVSPLPKTLNVRAGDLAAAKLNKLRKDEAFRKAFDKDAQEGLAGKSAEEQRHRLTEFPGSTAAQEILNAQCVAIAKENTQTNRKLLWKLSDIARSSNLAVPENLRARVHAPSSKAKPVDLSMPAQTRDLDLAGDEGTTWLVLERRGNRELHSDLLFIGGRVRKRLDNKFVLNCVDLKTGKQVWTTGSKIRLRGLGQEPGFFEAFVYGDVVIVHGLYDVIAFGIKDGKELWRYRVPFDFEIEHAVMSGDVLVLAGKAETVALYVGTTNKNGEVIWQEKEEGDVYIAPYFYGDRLVSVRKLPFNVTVRYRGTGRLIGRLALPDLTLHEAHPLLKDGPKTVPAAHEGSLLVLSDEWYYIALDVTTLTVRWKRLLDASDVTRRPAMRLTLGGDYLTAIKEDYDIKTIYMLSSKTGEVLARTDPKNAKSPQPVYSSFIVGDRLYGIGIHPGQAFYLTCLDCKTGKRIYQRQVKGYQAKPTVKMMPRLFGKYLVVRVQDRQEFELQVFEAKTGKPVHKVHLKGVGSFDVHGRVSATVQNGRVVLLSKNKMKL